MTCFAPDSPRAVRLHGRLPGIRVTASQRRRALAPIAGHAVQPGSFMLLSSWPVPIAARPDDVSRTVRVRYLPRER